MSGDRTIECLCGNWEVMSVDDSRDKSQSFAHQRNLPDGEAYYNCNQCGSTVLSSTETPQEIEVESQDVTVTHRYTEIQGCLVQRTGWANYEGVTVSITGKDVLTPVTIELTHEQVDLLKAVL
ncbi:hypothetical protein ALT721_800013 [Alteromonas alvinellae]